MKPLCRISLLIVAFSLNVFSQVPKSVTDPAVRDELNRQALERNLEDRISNMRRLNNNQLSREDREAILNKRNPKPPKETAEQRAITRKILSPNPADLTRFKDFLEQSKTGLFRLFPDLNCGSRRVVRVDGDCANIIPGTWFYSFRQKDYSNDTYTDISLKNGNLIGGGFLSQAVLVNLGDIPLDTVSLDASGLKFLADLKPETQSIEVKKQASQIAKGIEADGFRYLRAVKASENTTYAMRLIAYRSENKVANRFIDYAPESSGIKYLNVNYDKRSDLILAFRVVRQDADGNLTILWKELSRKDSPKIVFGENEKLTDIR